MLIKGMTTQEIRVLQEYRRIGAERMSLDAVKAIKHPTGGGDVPAKSLVTKGFLAEEDGGQNLALTEKAKDFLAFDPKPEFEDAGAASE